jgi:hypothetical protein
LPFRHQLGSTVHALLAPPTDHLLGQARVVFSSLPHLYGRSFEPGMN